jgi:hypothetical protein
MVPARRGNRGWGMTLNRSPGFSDLAEYLGGEGVDRRLFPGVARKRSFAADLFEEFGTAPALVDRHPGKQKTPAPIENQLEPVAPHLYLVFRVHIVHALEWGKDGNLHTCSRECISTLTASAQRIGKFTLSRLDRTEFLCYDMRQ